jgi:hypothetical protein
MKRIFLLLIVITCISAGIAIGQKVSDNTPLVLEKLYDRLTNSHEDSIRLQINDSIIFIINSYVSSDTVFTHRFKDLRYLGQIISPDSSIKIITWNLILRNSQSRYFCYFIRKPEFGKKTKIYKLTASYKEDPIRTDTTYNEKDWYGALYYDIRPNLYDGKKCWILLGIDVANPEIGRKIIDVLNITSDEEILFGRKWFESEGKLKYRDVFEYASNGTMSLRFKSDSSVVFDHLVPFSSFQKNDRKFYGPDYSYDAYDFSKGLWRMIINVDARNNKE